MRLAVTGSRHWKNKQQIWDELDKINRENPIRCLIHGGAIGADTYASSWATDRKIVNVTVRPANYKIATDYLERNQIIVELCDKLVVFRADGKSNGTDQTKNYALKRGKLYYKEPVKEIE